MGGGGADPKIEGGPGPPGPPPYYPPASNAGVDGINIVPQGTSSTMPKATFQDPSKVSPSQCNATTAIKIPFDISSKGYKIP